MISIIPSSSATIRVHHLNKENRLSLSRHPLKSDVILSLHVDKKVPVVLIVRVICVTNHILTKFKSLPSVSYEAGAIDWCLGEGVHVEHVLSLGEQIVESIVWAKADVVATSSVVVVFLSAVVTDSVILIVLGGQEMLWEIIPLGVEEYLVEDDISQKDNRSLLNCTPPWPEGVEALLILIQ